MARAAGVRHAAFALAAVLLLTAATPSRAEWPTEGGDKGVVITVTSLADSGPGTFRAAVMVNKPRRIVFKVGGEIVLKQPLVIQYPDVTVAGETAPAPGISLLGDKLRIKTHDVIVRHIRVRVGELPGNSDPSNRDGISIDLGMPGMPVRNILIDHCSVAWAIDEGLSTWGAGIDNVLIRRTIVAETLNNSIHEKGAHSSGLLIGKGARNILVQGNLLADNAFRNPVIDGGADAVVVNNLIYNPGFSGFHVYPKPEVGPTNVAVVGNVLLAGPDTRPRIYSFSMGINPGSKIYYADNKAVGTVAFTETEKARGQPVPFVDTPPVWFDWIKPLPSSAVEKDVLADVGARPDDRDATDKRIIAEVSSNTGSIKDTPVDERLRVPRPLAKARVSGQ